jgi:hypothetical protein
MAQGLIAAALGGFGKALSSVGEMEAKKQNEAKLRKEIMAMESEERLRLDEITFGREMARAPIRATTQAKADVIGRSTKIDEENRLGVPEAEAKQTVTKNRLVTEQELKQNTPKLNAELKVRTRMAELAAGKENKLDEAEARAKYNAFMTDIKVAKELGADVAEAERLAEKENARISALIKSRVPAKEAQLANERKLETVRAQLDSTIITEEANLLAKQELAKVQAMTAQGVPEAEAKLLSAKWKAQKTQRDEAAAEKTQQEMNDLITKMKDPNYKKALITKEGIDVTGSRILQADRDKKEKDEKERNSVTMQRQIDATRAQIAEALGVEPKKVNEEKAYLEELAAKGDTTAKAKLAKIQPLVKDLDVLRGELRSLQRGSSGADSSSGKTAYKIGETRKIESGPNKDKFVEWDGNGWVLKK